MRKVKISCVLAASFLAIGTMGVSASSYQPIRPFLSDFGSMTDLQREKWQKENESKHIVSGACRVHDVNTTSWLSAFNSPEADFVVDCRISASQHVALYFGQAYEDKMHSLSKGTLLEFTGKLKTIQSWGFWNTAYVLVSDRKKASSGHELLTDMPDEEGGKTQPHSSEEVTRSSGPKYVTHEGTGERYLITLNENGAVLKSENDVLYLGNSCDAMSPRHGRGTWGWANGGWRVEFSDSTIGFPRKDPPFAFSDDRCRF